MQCVESRGGRQAASGPGPQQPAPHSDALKAHSPGSGAHLRDGVGRGRLRSQAAVGVAILLAGPGCCPRQGRAAHCWRPGGLVGLRWPASTVTTRRMPRACRKGWGRGPLSMGWQRLLSGHEQVNHDGDHMLPPAAPGGCRTPRLPADLLGNQRHFSRRRWPQLRVHGPVCALPLLLARRVDVRRQF